MVNTTGCWLSFSLTPCQSFISSARTVRDLKVGSALLSYLVGEAMLAGLDQCGELLFPAVDRDAIIKAKRDGSLHIPNQFVMEFESEEAAAAAAQAAEDALRAEWSRIAADVKKHLSSHWDAKRANWSEQWDEQIGSLWEVRTITYSPSPGDTNAYDKLYAEPRRSDWQRQWRLLAAALRASKQVRHFPGDQGIGRPKCSMMGELEQMGPGGDLRAQYDFWRAVSGLFAWPGSGIRIGERDRLCAVSLTKRFAPCVVMEDLRKEIPDTAWIATESWRAKVAAVAEAGELLRHWEHAARRLANLLGEEADTPGRYLLADERRPEAFAPDGLSDKKRTEAITAATTMLQARRQLLEAARKAKPGSPPRYFAALCLDGDHIGKWLSGEFHGDRSFGADECRAIGHKLRDYAALVPEIVAQHHGYLVYAGGDDALALLPIDTALECARKLRNDYPQLGPSGAPPTAASAGLAYGHYMHDLRDMLAQAREAAKEAKDWERNALGWRVLRRSGAISRGVVPWGVASRVSKFAGLFEQFSDRWVYRLAEIQASAFRDWDDDAPVCALTRYFAERVEEDKKKLLAAEAVDLYEDLRAFLDTCLPSVPPDGYRTAGSVLKALTDNLGLSSFIASVQ